ncbi:MAG: glycine--tRNA ligase subunit beta [Gammaproteobacteria bacterium]|nr:glycine--tRNA ligase subunit beta [Gammaproteobacteria bacterium]
MSATLLVEIGTEELPPKALLRLSTAFAAGIEKALAGAGFAYEAIVPYAAPRRLAVSVSALGERQPDRVEQRRGPAVKAAFDADGNPTKAALGFARSCGVEVEALGRVSSGNGEWLAFEAEIPGRTIDAVLGEMVEQALAGLPIPKRMRWGAGEVEFVRPVHWVVALYGSAVVPCTVLGLTAGRTTQGHRFHHGGSIALADAADYVETLAGSGHVLADFAQRRARILAQVAAWCDEHGLTAVLDPELVDEVTALVEWPAVIGGSFDAAFLALPEEALIASMQGHQKYFPLRDRDGRLANRFLTVSNIESTDPALVQDGNERVIRPRLADADFFYRTDRARPLAERVAGLADMLFEKRLGSLADKTARVERLAARIAAACGAEPAVVERAAHLARADLLSAMVGEFPELQGTMGGYYAAADGEDAAVATALGEFYQPRFAGDVIPASPAGRAIALADKLDSLVGIFGIGLAPTGDKDPYALRRAALGSLRILIEGDIDLDLLELIEVARAIYGEVALAEDTAAQVYAYMRERLRGYYQDRGIPGDVCAAVLANDPTAPREIARRIDAVAAFREHAAAAALAAANKRIGNILKKLDGPAPGAWSAARLVDDAERALAAAIETLMPEVEAAFAAHAYDTYLARLASLRGPVDRFFDEVMVMCEDAALRDNRLALLNQLHGLFGRVADIGRLHDA